MDLASRKYKFMEQFMKIASEEKIEKLERFFRQEILEEEISSELKEALDIGIEQIKEGKTFSTEEVMTRVKTKYNIA